LIASAPDYAFGQFDDIPAITQMAKYYGLGCHVDCCLGSYVNPFTAEAGFKVPYPFDFTQDGVTSISCDTHKYAYGPKGLSVLMFKTKALRKGTLFATVDWTGGIYATPSIAGSRSGAVIAGTWASLMSFGREGYKEKARAILEAARNIREGLSECKDLQVINTQDT